MCLNGYLSVHVCACVLHKVTCNNYMKRRETKAVPEGRLTNRGGWGKPHSQTSLLRSWGWGDRAEVRAVSFPFFPLWRNA